MIQNIIIESISKGVFFGACIFIIVLIMLVKMPNADVSTLVFKIFRGFANYYYWGYIACILVIIGWYLHIRWLIDRNVAEMDRLVEERNSLQKKFLDSNFTGSDS